MSEPIDATENEDGGRVPHSRRRIVVATLIAAGGVAVGVALGATTTASAAGTGSGSAPAPANCRPGGPGGPGRPKPAAGDFDGTVTAVSSSSITLKDAKAGSRTYAITAKTAAHNGPKTIAISKLSKGEHVHVRGSKSGSTYSAVDIDVVPKGHPGRPAAGPGRAGPATPPNGTRPSGDPRGAPKPPQATPSGTSS